MYMGYVHGDKQRHDDDAVVAFLHIQSLPSLQSFFFYSSTYPLSRVPLFVFRVLLFSLPKKTFTFLTSTSLTTTAPLYATRLCAAFLFLDHLHSTPGRPLRHLQAL